MLTALYSIFVLIEWGIAGYMTAKFVTDYAWEKTVKFITFNSLWNSPEIEAVMSTLTKEN